MNKELNLLMVAPHYLPYTGGAVTHMYEVGRRLVRNGIKVTILTTVAHDFPVPLPERECREGVEIIRVPAWPRKRDYCFAPKIFSLIKPGSWDLVHCQGCHTFVPLLAMLAARRACIPYILTFHSGGHSSHFRAIMRRLLWQLLRPLFVDAKKLISVSRFEHDYFRAILHLPANKMTIIPNGSDLPKVLDQKAISSHSANQSLIISIGRLEHYKGHQRLITALPKIREQLADAQLLILGTGPYESTLRALAQNIGMAAHVTIQAIPGEERQQLTEILSQAMLVALLSEYEAHPIAVLEALALHRPVLAADTAGLRELAQQGLVRAIPLHSTPEEIAQAAVQQIQDPILSPASFALPTWDVCAEQLQAMYTEVIGNSCKSGTRTPDLSSGKDPIFSCPRRNDSYE